MDFFERLLHVSPDGGNGSLEALYLLAIPALCAALLFRRQIGKRLRDARDVPPVSADQAPRDE